MTSDRWKQIETVFHAALEKPPSERPAFLDAACGDDESLRHEVESLLEGHDVNDFLDAASPLTSGSRLGHYEIFGPLGRGGMGEVWRARDTTLGREVAIKTLPEAFADDPDFLARFRREAQLLASLNHPNIAAIYGLEEDEGRRFLVLELVEGETLEDLLKTGALAEDEALKLAFQIADALEAAHERGVIHRDLKPANIKVGPDGTVKVLDFGLAKSLTADRPDVDLSASPTISEALTERGAIIGTAAYMSPEQARGRGLDKRTDVWSFGVVLYEMLTGTRLFDGETVSDVLAGVLKNEPDWDAVPVRFRKLVRRCLERNPDRRLKHIGDMELLLENGAVPIPPPAPGRRPTWLWPAIASLAVIAAASLFLLQPQPNEPIEALQFEIAQPDNIRFTDLFAVSPDGRYLTFVGTTDDGAGLWIRDFATQTFRLFEETTTNNNISLNGTPIWSPDGRFVAYWSNQEKALMKVSVASGTVQRIADVPASVASGFWSTDDEIVFRHMALNGLLKVSAQGGTPVQVTSGLHTHVSPLPDGRFLYTDIGDPALDDRVVYIGAIDRTPEEQEPIALLNNADAAAYVPGPTTGGRGYLLVLRDGTVSAERFDPDTMERGESVVIATDVTQRPMSATNGSGVMLPLGFSASQRRFVHRTAEMESMRLTWFDVNGTPLSGYDDLANYSNEVVLSPGGDRLAAARDVEPGQFQYDIYIHSLTGPERNIPLTDGASADISPVWSPGGDRIAYASFRGDDDGWDLYIETADASGNPEIHPINDLDELGGGMPTSWSPNGRYILLSNPSGANPDIWLLDLDSGETRRLIATSAREGSAEISPDGRWVSYASNAGGQFHVYVQVFDPAPGSETPPSRVSVESGLFAHWAEDSRRLFFSTNDPRPVLKVAEITGDENGNPVPGEPRPLFPADPAGSFLFWDVAPDGDRFIMPVAVPLSGDAAAFRVFSGWTAALDDASER